MPPVFPPIDALVIESDPLAAELLQRGLEEMGFTVTVSPDWPQAWEGALRRVPRLVVAPLAHEAGFPPTGIRRLRSADGGRRAVVLATHARTLRPDRQSLVELGVDDFLAYPIEPDELEVRLAIARSRVLERQAANDPATALNGIHQAMARSDEAALVLTPDEATRSFRVQSVNGAFERLTGYAAAAVSGRSHRVLVEAQDSEALLQCLRESVTQNRAAALHARGLRQDGRAVPMEWSLTPIPAGDGPHRGVLCILRPVGGGPDWAQQLRAAEEKFRNLVDVSLQGVLVHQDWKLRFVNRTLAEMLGYSEADAVLALERLEALIAPEDQERLKSFNEARKRGHAPEHYELHMVRRDGRQIALEAFVRQIFWEGEPAVLASYVDVTERKQAQADLQASRALLQGVFDALPHNVFVKDRDAKYLAVNRALADVWGTSPDSVVGKGFVAPGEVPPQERREIESSDRQALESGARMDFIMTRTIPNLGERRFRVIKVPLRDAAGTVTGLVGISEDVTERLEAEEALRESRALLQTVFDAIPHDVFVKDRQRRFVMINASMGKTWQRRPEEVVGSNLRRVGTNAPDEVAVLDETDRRVLEDGLPVDEIITRTMISGEVRQYRLIKRPLRDASGAITGMVGIAEDNTERLVAEDSLRRSQALLRTIFDTVPQGLFMKDQQGRFIMVNQRLSDRWGAAPEEMIGQRMGRTGGISPEDERAILESDAKVLSTGQSDEYTAARTLIDGSVRQYRYVKSPVRGDDGEVVGIVGIAEDITERLQREDELRESRALFQTTLDTIPAGVYVKDREGRYLLANRTLARWWKIPQGAFAGEQYAPAPNRPEAEVQAVLATDREVLLTGRPLDRVLTITLPSGPRGMRLVKTPLRDGSGAVVGLVGIDEDITEQLAAREALQRSQALLQAVFDAIPHHMFVKDAQNRYVTVNRAFAAVWGGTPASFAGKGTVEAQQTPPEEMERIRVSDQALLDTGVSVDEEILRTTPQGVEHHRIIKAPVWGPDGRVAGLVGIAEDISERKRNEEALRKSEERYRRLIEDSPNGILIHRNRAPLYVNPAFARLFGYDSPAEVLSLDTIDHWVAPGELERVRGYAASRLQNDMSPPETYEFQGKKKDGTLIWVQNSVRPVEWEGQRALQATMLDITEGKLAAANLAESQRLLRTLIDTLPQAIHVKDRNGTYRVVNAAMARIHGMPVEDLVGRTLASVPLRNASQVAAIQAAEAQAMREGRLVEIPEMESERPDGSRAWERLMKVPLRDEAGEVVGVVGVATDITASKHAEDELRDNQRLLQTVFDTLPQSLSLKDTEGRYLFVNKAFQWRNGIPANEIQGQGADHLPDMAPEQARQIRLADMEVVETGKTVELPEMRSEHKETGTHWVRLIKAPFRDSSGKVSGIVTISEDLTWRRRAEQGLRDSQRLLQTVINALPQSIYVKDLKGTYQLVNSAVIQRHNLAAPEVLSHSLEDIAFGDAAIAEEIRKADSEVLKSGELVEMQEFQLYPAGQPPYWSRVIKTPLRNEQGHITGIITVAEDVTARREAEAQRLDLERQILHAQKLESLGVLAGGIAHDFNNLLTGILGNVELAMMDTAESHPATPTLQQVKQASLRAAALTQQMLAYSGHGRLQVQQVDLNALVEEMAQLLKVSISKRITIQYHLAGQLPAVEGDPAQVQQIVMNLITNASEAIGDNRGVIRLATGQVTADRAYLDSAYLAETLPEGDYVFMEVADTGSGMSEDVQARIFDPFFTTKFTGRGLGLAAVLGIVRSHHGTIHIQSMPGEGSTFRVLFPAAGNLPKTQSLPEPPPTRWRGSGTVLVVDDEPIVRSVLERQLKSLGFEVVSAANGNEALAKFQANPAGIVAALLDMTMPDMDGVETLAALKRIRADVRVIVCSGYSEQDAAEQFGEVVPDAFLQKPAQMEQLSQKLRDLLG